MTIDPLQLGQAVGAAVLAGITCVAAVRQGLARWGKQQAQERKAANAQDKRALRGAIRSELRDAMGSEWKAALAEQLTPFIARLERVERAVEGMVKRRRPRPAPPGRKAPKRS